MSQPVLCLGPMPLQCSPGALPARKGAGLPLTAHLCPTSPVNLSGGTAVDGPLSCPTTSRNHMRRKFSSFI